MTPLDRRTFLRAAAGAAGAACLPLAGCGETDETGAAPGPLRVPLAELPDGERVRRDWAGTPVELRRDGATVTARSLLCTHQGCEVAWDPAADAYVCPCHDGRFDAAGRPVYGPPRAPLRTLPVAVADGHAVVEAPVP